MSKHTKGPWTMRESNFAFHIYGVFKKSKNAFITASYWSNPDYGASREEAKANAQLIAAAPYLLEALKKFISAGYGNSIDGITHAEAWVLAKAAIAKAEGGAA